MFWYPSIQPVYIFMVGPIPRRKEFQILRWRINGHKSRFYAFKDTRTPKSSSYNFPLLPVSKTFGLKATLGPLA